MQGITTNIQTKHGTIPTNSTLTPIILSHVFKYDRSNIPTITHSVLCICTVYSFCVQICYSIPLVIHWPFITSNMHTYPSHFSLLCLVYGNDPTSTWLIFARASNPIPLIIFQPRIAQDDERQALVHIHTLPAIAFDAAAPSSTFSNPFVLILRAYVCAWVFTWCLLICSTRKIYHIMKYVSMFIILRLMSTRYINW